MWLWESITFGVFSYVARSFLEAESTPGHMVLSVATEKIPSDTTGNWSRDRPTSSAVPYVFCSVVRIFRYIYITRLASNEIFSPPNNIHREVGRAKDLPAPRYSKLPLDDE